MSTTERESDELNVKTKTSSRSRFANGGNRTMWRELSYPDRVPEGMSLVHNNWIAGHAAKSQRFHERGMLMYDAPNDRCVP